MNLQASIIISGDVDNLQKLLTAESNETGNKRSSFHLEELKDRLIIKINAKDPVALRTTLNTVTKILTVYEQTRGQLK